MKKNKKIIFYVIISILFITIAAFGLSFANSGDPTLIDEGDDLVYYLTISYDSMNQYHMSSSDTNIIQEYSNVLNVEDVLPEGLIYNGIVSTPSNTIGAVRRSDGVSWKGAVKGGVDGIVYDKDSRKISFSIEGLQAGCSLTVGIKSKTPFLLDKDRMDFYNTALLKYSNYTVLSNSLHHYIGKGLNTSYKVVYQYSGELPEGAPTLPNSDVRYDIGSEVSVLPDIEVAGYRFSGWETPNVTVENGKFIMPSSTVVFTGSFEK